MSIRSILYSPGRKNYFVAISLRIIFVHPQFWDFVCLLQSFLHYAYDKTLSLFYIPMKKKVLIHRIIIELFSKNGSSHLSQRAIYVSLWDWDGGVWINITIWPCCNLSNSIFEPFPSFHLSARHHPIFVPTTIHLAKEY